MRTTAESYTPPSRPATIAWLWIILVFGACPGGPAAGQSPGHPAGDASAASTAPADEAPSGGKAAPAGAPPAPGPAPSPVDAPPAQPVLKLTLDQSVRFALDNNLELQVSRLGTRITHSDIDIARGRFDPIPYVRVTRQKSSTQTGSTLSGAGTLRQLLFQGTLGIKGILPLGTTYDLSGQSAMTRTNSTFSSLNPQWQTTLGVTVTQPLLRGAWPAANLADLRTAEANFRVADIQNLDTVLQTTYKVVSAYWDLVFAVKNRAVKQKALESAQDLLNVNKNKHAAGALPEVDVLEAEAGVAAREEDILVADKAVDDARDALLKLILPVRESSSEWNVTVVPTDEPIVDAPLPGTDESVTLALQRRPDFRALMEQVKAQDLTIRKAANGVLPLVDLEWTYKQTGLSGQKGDSLDEAGKGDFPDWTLGLLAEFPIGNHTARGTLQKAQHQKQQLVVRLHNLEQTVIAEVREGIRQIATGRQRILANQKSVALAHRQVEAEVARRDAQKSTSFQVVQAQSVLAEAEGNYTRALVDFQKALYNLRRVTGTLLDDYGVTDGK